MVASCIAGVRFTATEVIHYGFQRLVLCFQRPVNNIAPGARMHILREGIV